MMKIGVMGLGNIAQKAYVPVMNDLRREVEWHYYSRDEEKMADLAARHDWQFVYTNKESFLASGLDACFIHTPTPTHGTLIEELLTRGIHVFVDKPVSEDFQEVADLHRLAEERGLILMTGFNRRFASLNQQLKSVPAKNMIIAQKNRMEPKGQVKFEIFDMLIHVVDTVLYLLDDEIIDVRYQLSAEAGVLKRAMITFETATTTAMASTNMEAGAHTETVEIQAAAGTYCVANLDQLKKNEQGQVSLVGFGDWEDTLTKRGFRSLIEAFVESVKTGQPSTITTAASSLQSHYYIAQLLAYYDNQLKQA